MGDILQYGIRNEMRVSRTSDLLKPKSLGSLKAVFLLTLQTRLYLVCLLITRPKP